MVHGGRERGAPGCYAGNYSGMLLRFRMDSPSIWMVTWMYAGEQIDADKLESALTELRASSTESFTDMTAANVWPRWTERTLPLFFG